MIKIISALSVLALLSGCFNAFAQTQPDSTLRIHMLDYCDPASFNAILGAGTCVRDTTPGLITFNGFLSEVGAEKSAGAWRFSPSRPGAGRNDSLTITNLGGETHTFTKVQKFGGGFVDVLNVASGNPKPAPECATVVNGNLIPQPPGPDNLFIPAGGSATHAASDQNVRYQCCIHPWMRTIVHIKASHD